MRTAWTRYRADFLCLAGLLVLTLAFFWPVTLGLGFIPRGGGDLASFLWPTYSYAAHAYTTGRLPLWNPTLYAGAPFAADPQTAAFYPLNLVAYIVAPGFPYVALEALVMVHVWLAGAGMYALLRVWLGPQSERVAALTGAVALMFCDVFIIHVGNYNIIAAACWLPFALAAFQRALEGGGAWMRLAASVALALSMLAGHAQLTLMVWGAVGLYALGSTAAVVRSGWHVVGRRAALSLQVLGVAALLSAVAWLPAAELQGYTARAALTYAQATEYSLPWSGLAGLFSPLLLGRGSGDFWAPWQRVEAGYVGVATLLLAAFALARRPSAISAFLVVLGLGGFALALGPNTPVHGWVYDLIAIFRGLRVPARFIFLTDFALAGLAGLGMHYLVASAGRRWALATLAMLLAGGATMAYGFEIANVAAGSSHSPWLAVGVAGGLAVAVALLGTRRAGAARWLVWALLVADLIGQGSWVEMDTADPTLGFDHPVALDFLLSRDRPTRIDVAATALAPDAAARFNLEDIGGIYNPLGLAAMQTYRDSLGSRGSARYDFLGAQWIVADKDQPPADDPQIVPVFIDDPALDIYLNNGAQPRLTLRAVAEIVETGEALARLTDPAFDITRSVLIEPVVATEQGQAGAATPPRWDTAGSEAPGSLVLEAYDPEYVRVRVTTAVPTWLVLADAWYPGWRATVDGEPVPIFRANLAFRAIALERPGEHVVEMVFVPASQALGGTLALVGVMAVVGDLAWEAWRRREEAARSGSTGATPEPPERLTGGDAGHQVAKQGKGGSTQSAHA